ncbi:MAG: hypothetical protein Q8N05_01305 [Bacteroidota bacterium]|nr:hypothetical protein [Bacteroidota bacterium]
MKRQILFFAIFVTLNFIFIACDKNETTNPKDGGVELYLLESCKTISGTNHQIDERTIVTKSQPLVTYTDFQSYDPNTFTFKISDAAKKTIKSMQYSVYGIPFAIKANNVVIYSGYFWPSYSSASCDWVVIDPLSLLIGNDLKVELGYPGLREGQIIPDSRNDKRILDIFTSDDKLIK